ncbi:MAG TPA: ATP-binding protein [Chloroflexi bacterium]|nr:ATP-binding protein [Chloroflexota bacterium]
MSNDPEPDTTTQTAQPTAIGRTSATEREAITSDKFAFWLPDEVIVNPFDIVAVEQVNQPGEPASRTYGLVTMLEHRTDAPNHLANFISSNFGALDEEPNTNRQGTTVASVNVLSNSEDIYMPVPSERLVTFADKAGIENALGIDQMALGDRIPAGLIKMSNGAGTVAYIDRNFVLGPESAHVNISGISGLATKTSYAMFLLQAILQTAEDPDDIAIIILNVKQGDLLRIDERGPELPPEQKAMWEALGLEPLPFKNVRYLLPRGLNAQPNSFVTPSFSTLYAYDLDCTKDKLDLLFTNISDPTSTMESIIGDIMQGLEGRGDAAFRNVSSWQNLLYSAPLFKDGKSQGFGDNRASSVGKFRRHLRRLVETRQTGIFVGSRSRNEKVLANELTNIKGGHTYVVDIAKLKDEEQTLVFGDLLRTIYSLKAEDVEDRTETSDVPEKIIFFVDELNKYAPSGSQTSPITAQVLDIAERGRSLGVILISAQQFMSAVHGRVTGNSATKILGRTGSQEVGQPDYRFLDNDLKMAMTRLAKGELLINHAVYRQPVKVIFPKPAYRQEQS